MDGPKLVFCYKIVVNKKNMSIIIYPNLKRKIAS